MKAFVTKTQSLPSDKLLVLIRDGHTYYRNEGLISFYSLFNRDKIIEPKNFSDLKSTDKLYAFDKNEQIAETLNASGCLNKFLLKIESEVTFAQVYEAVKDGKFVGATRVGSDMAGAKVAVKISPYSRHKQPALYAFYNNGKDSDLVGSQGNCDFKNGGSGTHKDFVWTDNEFEFWKWLNT